MALENERASAVAEAVDRIRTLTGGTVTREALSEVREVLYSLARRRELFPVGEFSSPDPASGKTSTRYELHADGDEGFALYLNALAPGKSSQPHNHGTWAVIVALEGEELNRIYERRDDGSDPERADLHVREEFVVRPDHGITFLPDDIHSIHLAGDRPARHFHLYGRALETLTDRLGFDLETGRVLNYNKNFFVPSVRLTPA